jgi:uncharacterized membrane protein
VVDFSIAGFVAALLITIVEMTEVVALVFALSAEHGSVRSGALGAVAGSAVVGVAALAFGAYLTRLPADLLLIAASVVLFGFGLFLLRSTIRSFRRARTSAIQPSGTTPHPRAEAIQFAGGFSIGSVEMIETVIVLLALTAAGEGFAALVGAAVAIVLLVVIAALLHERVRRIKTPMLKLFATSMLFSFAVFWAGEAAGLNWPGSDLILVPLVAIAFVSLYYVVRWRSALPIPVETKG